MPETLHCPVEIREANGGPTLHGVLIQEGRAASARAEVFAPLSLVWASNGIALRAKHLGAEDSRAIPTREANGEIRIEAPASAAIVAAFNEGRRHLSIEFHALQETKASRASAKFNRLFSPPPRSFLILSTRRRLPRSAPVVAERKSGCDLNPLNYSIAERPRSASPIPIRLLLGS